MISASWGRSRWLRLDSYGFSRRLGILVKIGFLFSCIGRKLKGINWIRMGWLYLLTYVWFSGLGRLWYRDFLFWYSGVHFDLSIGLRLSSLRIMVKVRRVKIILMSKFMSLAIKSNTSEIVIIEIISTVSLRRMISSLWGRQQSTWAGAQVNLSSTYWNAFVILGIFYFLFFIVYSITFSGRCLEFLTKFKLLIMSFLLSTERAI